jgi:hypothetical protein
MARWPTIRGWRSAEAISHALMDRYPGKIHAIGAHGSLAHRDDVDGSDVSLTVVTKRAGGGPAPTSRRVRGIAVDIDVISADGLLNLARTLSPSWPLLADRYLTALALYDPMHWHDRLRDAHLAHLAEAKADEFARLPGRPGAERRPGASAPSASPSGTTPTARCSRSASRGWPRRWSRGC